MRGALAKAAAAPTWAQLCWQQNARRWLDRRVCATQFKAITIGIWRVENQGKMPIDCKIRVTFQLVAISDDDLSPQRRSSCARVAAGAPPPAR